jgi:hypothetical protein
MSQDLNLNGSANGAPKSSNLIQNLEAQAEKL